MSDEIITKLLTAGPHQVLETPRQVRATFNGLSIFNTTHALHVWEHAYYPQLYIPLDAITPGVLVQTTQIPLLDASNIHGQAYRGLLTVDEQTTEEVVIFQGGVLDSYVRFQFQAMDAWFEENVQLFGDHPRSPFVRIDALPSGRKVQVAVEGVLIADSENCVFLYETGLQPRYYMPKTDVNMQYLKPSTTTTNCPYKGKANYYDVVIGDKEYPDLVWWYEYPTHESSAIAGMLCFYAEKCNVIVSTPDGPMAVGKADSPDQTVRSEVAESEQRGRQTEA